MGASGRGDEPPRYLIFAYAVARPGLVAPTAFTIGFTLPLCLAHRFITSLGVPPEGIADTPVMAISALRCPTFCRSTLDLTPLHLSSLGLLIMPTIQSPILLSLFSILLDRCAPASLWNPNTLGWLRLDRTWSFWPLKADPRTAPPSLSGLSPLGLSPLLELPLLALPFELPLSIRLSFLLSPVLSFGGLLTFGPTLSLFQFTPSLFLGRFVFVVRRFGYAFAGAISHLSLRAA